MICADDDPKKVDSILRGNYGYGIYEFAHCLADLLYHEFRPYESNSLITDFHLPEKFFDDLVKKFKNLKDKTIKILDEIESSLGYIGRYLIEYKNSSLENNEIENNGIISTEDKYNLRSFFKIIDEKIRLIKEAKVSVQIKCKGREIRARNKIAFVWSFVMKKSNSNRPDWKIMADLLDWFYWNLKGTEYAARLLPPSGEVTFDADHIKREVNRLKSIIDKNEYLSRNFKKLKEHYFPEIRRGGRTTIDFTEEIEPFNPFPPVGGEEFFEEDKYPLIVFPNGKTFP